MEIPDADIAAMDRLIGPATRRGLGSAEDRATRFGRLGDSRLVSLEILLARRAEFESVAASYSADDVRSNHVENMRRLDGRIRDLVATIRGSGDSLTTEAEAILVEAEGQAVPAPVTAVIDVTASVPRRGR